MKYIALSLPTNNPNDRRYLVSAGMGYDGVVLLELPNNEICTGSLLWSGKHILTAAHCLRDRDAFNSFFFEPNETTVTVVFRLTLGTVRREVKEIFLHPQWNGSENGDSDIAILELEEVAPATAERYSIYRRSDEVGKIFTRVGYGVGGTGQEGERRGDRAIQKRFGGNRYDTLREALERPEIHTRLNVGKQLVYDFDSGLRSHDALGREYGIHGLGIIGYDTGTSRGFSGNWQLEIGRQYEAGSTSGDSGSPAFIEGKIAGISSSGRRSTLPRVDVTSNRDSSFGEIFFDTRVSAYADFIDGIVNQSNEEIFLLRSGLELVLLGLMLGAIAAKFFK
ncbi:MAG: trypsin-like serine protease [Cyanobacteria bacterium SBLK]|nr:trypsin-like serine protease [Cyanobacteria bacterium SBLK]